jgi:hypothetical protein
MLTSKIVKKYSVVLHFITYLKAIPYKWDRLDRTMKLGDRRTDVFGWSIVFLLSWMHAAFVTTQLLLNSKSVSNVYRCVLLLWMCGSHLNSVLQLNILIYSNELVQFCNVLIQDSVKASGKSCKIECFFHTTNDELTILRSLMVLQNMSSEHAPERLKLENKKGL